MVLVLPRSVPRSLGSLASRRLFHQAAASPRPVYRSHPPRLTPTALPHRGTAFGRQRGGFPGPGTSIRMLTGAREKVKVLLVLYDGGQHAKDVSCVLLSFPRRSKAPYKRRGRRVGRSSSPPRTSPGDMSEGWSFVRGSSKKGPVCGNSPASWPPGRDLFLAPGTADVGSEGKRGAETGGWKGRNETTGR